MSLQLQDNIIEDEELLFEDETDDIHSEEEEDEFIWKVLIVDDDEQIHRVTKFALQDFIFEDHKLQLTHAYSGKEARAKLTEDEYGVIFLDVVMETDNEGLDVVNFIRKDLDNYRSRIILRTGQPGMAPEKSVVRDYDIDDYRHKADLSADKLHTSLCTSLRGYGERVKIDAIVDEKTHEVIEKNKEILESIHYAERIQSAIMPSIDYIHEHISQFGIFFKPKAIVSGDFYFFSPQEDKIVIANIDCTGHGVPGAIMSIFAYNLLSLTVKDSEIADCGLLLLDLDKKLQELLHQHGKGFQIQDGMDMSLVILYPQKKELHFAGANHSCYIYQNGELKTYEGSKFPIGDSYHENKKFTQHIVPLQADDTVYLFSDGIVDQFGGEEGRKFTSKRLFQLIDEIATLPIAKQISEVENVFNRWRGKYDQIDDVSFLAFKPAL